MAVIVPVIKGSPSLVSDYRHGQLDGSGCMCVAYIKIQMCLVT